MLESIEETFNNEIMFGEKLMPELDILRKKNVSFYGYKSVSGTHWTAAALTSYLFGLPLKVPNTGDVGNNMGRFSDQFLPSASTLASVFEKHGYEVTFFLGSKSSFGGQDKIFATHTASTNIYDFFHFEELKGKGKIDFDAEAGWGVPDYLLFDEVKKQLKNKRMDTPFFWIIQTIDTHEPYRFSGKVPAKWHDIRDSIRETSFVTADFIKWLQKQSFYSDTTIIILGDHPIMRDEIGGVTLPSRKDREVYNVFINPIPNLSNSSQRVFAAFDMAPTILESAGAVLPNGHFGVGVSLFDPKLRTVLEEKGCQYYEDEIKKSSSLYDSFFLKPKP